MKEDHVVEAALFAAGRPLSVAEVAEQTGLDGKRVKRAVGRLQKNYQERDTVLEIAKAGSKWAMQVQTRAAEPAAKFAPMEIPKKLLKTLALIAYHQPLKQSELSDMVGSRVYDHVPELVERGLVRARREGQTKLLSTTPEFPEYFGLDADSPQQIRTVLAKAVGLDPAKEARNLDAFNHPAPVGQAEERGEAAGGVAEEAFTAGATTPYDAKESDGKSEESGGSPSMQEVQMRAAQHTEEPGSTSGAEDQTGHDPEKVEGEAREVTT